MHADPVDGAAALDLAAVAHRPFPSPRGRPHVVMSWLDTRFLHWRMEASQLAPLVPAPMELDLHDGSAWVSVVAFHMRGKRLAVGIPLARTLFPELNVRTYVRRKEVPGIRFLSLDTPGRLVAAVGRAMGFHYRIADLRIGDPVEDRVRDLPALRFTCPPGAPRTPDGLDGFLVERYVAFGGRTGGKQLEVHHAPWPLYEADASVTEPGFLEPLVGDRQPDLAHFSPGVDAAGWYRVRR